MVWHVGFFASGPDERYQTDRELSALGQSRTNAPLPTMVRLVSRAEIRAS